MGSTGKKITAPKLNVRVHYEDTDFTGYVYHNNYLKYMERARTEIFGTSEIKEMFRNGCHFVVAQISIKYIYPGHFGDLLEVRTKVKYSRSPALEFTQSIFAQTREGEKETYIKLTEATTKQVLVNEKGLPRQLTDRIIAKLDQFPEA